MEDAILSRPGAVILSSVPKRRGRAALNIAPERDQSPVRVKPVDEFVALTQEDYISGSVPSINITPTPSNVPFNPQTPRLPKEEKPTGGPRIYNGSSDPRYGFGLYPESLYGPNWVQAHSTKVMMWYSESIIDFARTIAGKLNFTSVNEVLETGFEDMHKLIKEAQMDKTDLPAFKSPIEADKPDTSLFPAVPFESAPYNKATDELYKVTTLLRGMGTPESGEKFYRYLTHRTESRDAAHQKWLTLPMNLGNIYFKPMVKAGLEAAINAVSQAFPIYPKDSLFGILLRSKSREAFAQLACLHVQKNRFMNPNGYRTKHQGMNIDANIITATFEISQLGLLPDRVMEPEKEITVNSRFTRVDVPQNNFTIN